MFDADIREDGSLVDAKQLLLSTQMDTVLITGTTSGIGKAFAEQFAANGSNIILVSRNEDGI